MPTTRKTNAVAIAAAAILLVANTACAATGADYDRNVGTNIPVLVMGEDEDPNTVKRSSDIFKRVKVDGTNIRVDKLVPTPRHPRSEDERRRFH